MKTTLKNIIIELIITFIAIVDSEIKLYSSVTDYMQLCLGREEFT